MSADALIQVTLALQKLLHTALGGAGQPDDEVFIGPPLPGAAAARRASVLLFHVEPNREMRNEPRLRLAGGSDPEPRNALALDLRYLITVFRAGVGSTSPNELLVLGQLLAGLQAMPTIGPSVVAGQEVRLTPEPHSMEEMSRTWGLFPNAAYSTSVVYLASPVFVDANAMARGAPVVSRRLDSGTAAEPPDVFGTRAVAGQGGGG